VNRSTTSLVAATIINLPFGTLYAFSVLLKPVEALIGATRGEMSFVFGLTTVTLAVPTAATSAAAIAVVT